MSHPADEARPVTKAEQELYEEKVSTFEDDELSVHQRMRRRYGQMALGLGGLLAASQWQNWMLSRETRRMVVERDVAAVVVPQDTGAPFLVRGQVGPPVEVEDALIKHLAWQYVTAREVWSRAEDRDKFYIVQAMSGAEEQKRHKEWWERDPRGPRKMLDPHGQARIATRSEPQLRKRDPQGHWDHLEYNIRRRIFPGGNQPHSDTDLKLTLFFGWDRGAISDDVRLVNPFGFVVGDYRREWASPGGGGPA